MEILIGCIASLAVIGSFIGGVVLGLKLNSNGTTSLIQPKAPKLTELEKEQLKYQEMLNQGLNNLINYSGDPQI